MQMILSIAAGGALGSVLRHYAGKAALYLLGAGFPYGTLFVNIVGSFIMGIFIAMFAGTEILQETRAFLTIGLLGGFTTFSAFSLDVVTMWERGDVVAALAYVVLSVFVSIAALFLGLFIVRSFS